VRASFLTNGIIAFYESFYDAWTKIKRKEKENEK